MGTDGDDSDESDRADERDEESTQQIPGGPDLLDRVLKVLSKRRRRCVLYYLREQEVCEVDDLARYIVGNMAESSVVDESDSQETKIQLIHTDLPVIAEAGFIDYDSRSKTVRYTDSSPVLEKFLENTAEIDKQADPTDGCCYCIGD